MKYIITAGLAPILFPDHIDHSTFADLKPISAGFVRLHLNGSKIEAICGGKSVTLKLDAQADDYVFIEQLLNKRKD